MPVNLSQRVTGALSYANMYSGTAAAFIPPQSVLSIYATMDPATSTDTVTIGLSATQGGTSQQPIGAGFNVGAAQGTGEGPRVPDDVVLYNWGVPAMSSLILSAAAAATGDVLRVKTFISP